MRFILNFFFFGLLFYLIYLFFPDAFHTLVAWAQQAYDYLRDLFLQLSHKVNSGQGQNSSPTDRSLMIPFVFLVWKAKSYL